MLTRQNLYRLLLVGLLLAMLAMPVLGMAVDAIDDNYELTLFSTVENDEPATAIACNTGDPGSSGSGGGGC